MGRKHRNARKNRGARACAQKEFKVQPPAPPPETVGLPELPFDVIPLVLRALYIGCKDHEHWDTLDGEDRAAARAAACCSKVDTDRAVAYWSTLNKTHREAAHRP